MIYVIYVVATIHVAPGRRADVLREFHALAPVVRSEKGCLEYGPTIDVATGIPAQGAVASPFLSRDSAR